MFERNLGWLPEGVPAMTDPGLTPTNTPQRGLRLPSFRSLMDFGLVLGGTAFATATGFILKVVIGRRMGPDELGIFAMCYAVLTVLSILADVGVRYSMVNLGSRVVDEEPERVKRLIGSGLAVKVVAGAVVMSLGWLLGSTIAETVFRKPHLGPFLQITAVGVFLWVLWDGLEGALHIQQRFSTASGLRIIMDAGRLSSFFALFFYRDGVLLTMDRYMWLYFLCPGLSVAVGLVLVRMLMQPSLNEWRANVGELMHFGRGVFVYRAATLILLCIDSLMLTRYGALEQVGQFEAAKGLAYALLLVSESVGMVLLPKVNRINSLEQIRDLIRRCGTYFGVLALAALVWLSLAGRFLVVFGEKFTLPSVVHTFQIMVVVTLFTIPSTILGTVLLSLRRPDALGKIAGCQVLLAVLLYPVTCVQGGIIGTALTGVLLQCMGAVALALVLRKEIRGKTTHPAFLKENPGND
ncbi:MAG: lipopolysaccharide biosynthesis protein [Vulcanimicrobiota bacterium]